MKQIIYFMQAGDAVKIGITNNLNRRLRGVQVGCPTSIKVIHTIKGTKELERSIHCKLKEHHLHGEWYKIDAVLMLLRIELKAEIPKEIITNIWDISSLKLYFHPTKGILSYAN